MATAPFLRRHANLPDRPETGRRRPLTLELHWRKVARFGTKARAPRRLSCRRQPGDVMAFHRGPRDDLNLIRALSVMPGRGRRAPAATNLARSRQNWTGDEGKPGAPGPSEKHPRFERHELSRLYREPHRECRVRSFAATACKIAYSSTPLSPRPMRQVDALAKRSTAEAMVTAH